MAEAADSKAAVKGAGYALMILFLINTLNFFDRQLLGAFGESIVKEFALNDKALGFLGSVFTVVYAFVGLPLGHLTDRWRRTRLIALGTAVWSALTAATGMAQSYVQIFAARLGVGLGEATCAPAGQSLIGDLYRQHRRAFAMGVFMLGLPAGNFMAYKTAGWIGGTALTWRSAFYIACIPGFLLALLALLMREPARGALDAAKRSVSAEHGRGAYMKVLSLPTMWWIIASGIFHNFNMYALNTFNVSFLLRFHHLPLKDAGNISSISVGAVGAIGLIGGGWIADKMSAKRRNGRLVLSSICMAIAAPCIYLAINQPQGAIGRYATFMALGTATMYVYYATVYAAIQDVIEPKLRGTAVAIYFCCMYILGASMGPVGTGFLSDYFATQAMHAAHAASMSNAFRAAGLHQAMYVVPLLALLAALVLFAASRTIERDVRKQQLAHQPQPAPG